MKINRAQPLGKLIRRMVELETALNLSRGGTAMQRMEYEMGQIVGEINAREEQLNKAVERLQEPEEWI